MAVYRDLGKTMAFIERLLSAHWKTLERSQWDLRRLLRDQGWQREINKRPKNLPSIKKALENIGGSITTLSAHWEIVDRLHPSATVEGLLPTATVERLFWTKWKLWGDRGDRGDCGDYWKIIEKPWLLLSAHWKLIERSGHFFKVQRSLNRRHATSV